MFSTSVVIIRILSLSVPRLQCALTGKLWVILINLQPCCQWSCQEDSWYWIYSYSKNPLNFSIITYYRLILQEHIIPSNHLTEEEREEAKASFDSCCRFNADIRGYIEKANVCFQFHFISLEFSFILNHYHLKSLSFEITFT